MTLYEKKLHAEFLGLGLHFKILGQRLVYAHTLLTLGIYLMEDLTWISHKIKKSITVLTVAGSKKRLQKGKTTVE